MKGRFWSFVFGNNLLPIVLIVLAFIVYQKYAKTVSTSRERGPATVARQAKGTEKVPVVEKDAPPKIQTYDKVKLSGELKIPDLVFQPGEIIATAKIPPHSSSTTAWAGLDNTGRGYLGYSQDPPPRFQLKREGALEGFWFPYGKYAFTGDLVATPVNIYGLDLKAKAGVGLERDTQEVEWHVGLGVSYKFDF